MPAYKDKAKGTWYASFYYEDWTGKKVKKMKRGFPTKREALEWERTFLQQQTADLEMILSRLVDTFFSRISLTMLPVPKPHNTACVLSWEEARRWQSRSSGYSSS